MKLFAILVLIVTCLAVATKAQKSTQKPTTTKPTTLKKTTPKLTTLKITTPKPTTTKITTPKPATPKITTPKPATPKITTPKPTTTKITTPKPATPKITTPKPTTPKITTPKLTTPKITTPKPATPKITTPKPTTVIPNTTPKTTLKTTVKPTTLKQNVTTSVKSTSTLKSTTTNLIVTTTQTPNPMTTAVKTTSTAAPETKTTAVKLNVTTSTAATPQQTNVPTTAIKPNVSTTTLKPGIKFLVCRDANSTAPAGTIQLDQNSPGSYCSFDIVAPQDRQIRIYCSSLNFASTPSSNLIINGDLDTSEQLVLNRMYYSVNNTLTLIYSKLSNGDSFDCQWTTAPAEITSKPLLCRHAQSLSASGIIQPSPSDGGPSRKCFFSINVLPTQRIQISCSELNRTSETTLSIDGVTENVQYPGPVLNRVYYSVDNSVYLSSQVGNGMWFNCSWTTIPKPVTANSQFCLHGMASTANGTIQPMTGLTDEPKTCRFYITAPSNNQIQISCSVVNLQAPGMYNNYLSIGGVLDRYMDYSLILNRLYYSTADNNVVLTSQVNNATWFNCKWVTIPKENTTNSKLCRHAVSTTATGTIQPMTGDVDPPRDCPFTLNADYNKEIQISCSAINILNTDSYLLISGSNEFASPPVLNRVYYTSSQISVVSLIGNGDGFECNWITTPLQNTSDAKLCRHGSATSANGTLQPMEGDSGPPRSCSFSISAAPYDQQIQFSCSAINFVNPNSYFKISGTFDSANPPVVNRVYTSTVNNKISISSQLGEGDWISCQWTTTPRERTPDNKLCYNRESTTPNGTIQPFAGDTGSPRQCSFSILPSYNQQIEILCSTVTLADAKNYFRISGAIDSADPPIVKRLYASKSNTRIDISSKLGNGDQVKCNWTTTPIGIVSDHQFCRQTEAKFANGTIQRIAGDTGPPRECPFNIYAPSGQEIRIFCTAVSLTSDSSSFSLSGSVDGESIQPVVNRVYYSTSSNIISLTSSLGNEDWVNCQWITVPRMNTSDSKLCRHEMATTANGTITPLTGDTGPPRICSFTITNADSAKQIQISCSVVNLNSATSSLSIGGVIDSNVNLPVVNRVYTSTDYISLQSEIANGDMFNCKWTTVPKKNTTNSQLCLDEEATTANGTIQPIAGDVGPPRRCRFVINAEAGKQIQISCSVINLAGDTSFWRISGIIDSVSLTPSVNRVYTSTSNNAVFMNSRIGNGDWINCNWTTTPRENATNNKLCRHQSTVLKSGTIQPIAGDTGPSRECGFSINVYSSLQISCSTVNLVNLDSYLQFTSNSDNADPVNPPVANTVYTYPYGNIQFTSKVGDGDWFDCKWK